MGEVKKRRFDSLQSIRAIAFLAVFFTHLQIINNWGGWAVSVFIVLSGFLMAYSYYDRSDSMDISLISNVKFGIGKVRKLYPLHIIMFVFSLALLMGEFLKGLYDYSIPVLVTSIIANLGLVHSWIPVGGIYFSLNGVSWYLSVSLFLYICFPWIIRIIKNLSKKQLFILAIVIYLIMWIWESVFVTIFVDNEVMQTWFAYVSPLLRLCDFSIGAIFGVIFIKSKNEISKLLATIFEFFTIVFIILTVWYINCDHTSLVEIIAGKSTVICLPTSVALIYLFALNKGVISKLMSNKVLIYVGNMSPYGYLIHQGVIGYIVVITTKLLHIELSKWIVAVLSILLTWIAMYFYIFIEKKFIKKNRG